MIKIIYMRLIIYISYLTLKGQFRINEPATLINIPDGDQHLLDKTQNYRLKILKSFPSRVLSFVEDHQKTVYEQGHVLPFLLQNRIDALKPG